MSVPDEQRILQLCTLLALQPHPEGGFYREHFRGPPADGTRDASTAIYYLLAAHEVSAWHRVQHDELWHYYEGAPIEVHLLDDAQGYRVVTLGPVDDAGARPCVVVPRHTWQAARPVGGYVLVGNTVAPGFTFSEWELADAITRAELALRYPHARDALADLGH